MKENKDKKDMYILGVTSPISNNNAAAIIKNGVLIASAEEERFIRQKHAPRTPAINAVDFCLKAAGIKLSQVDYIAVGYLDPLPSSFIKIWQIVFKEGRFPLMPELCGATADYLIKMFKLYKAVNELDPKADKVKWVFIPHHQAHIASAYPLSGFRESNVIIVDGEGEVESGTLASASDGKVKTCKKINIFHSLGRFYGNATTLLGFKQHSQEGKTMGLAAYGNPNACKFDGIVKINSDSYAFFKDYEKKFVEKFGPKRQMSEPLTQGHKDLAAGCQNILEELGVLLAKEMYKKTKIGNFSLAGGVALNCDMNAKILRQPFVENIFIQPASHDAGCALGAAFELYRKLGGESDFVMEHAYWGPEYSNDEIESSLKEFKLKYQKFENIEEVTAKELAEGKIVGWFQGKMELGPRALGNRSILAHPGLENMKDKVNKEVKHREMWRPFAPSILEEAAQDYLEDYYPSPFMLLTFTVKEHKRKDLIAATHVDNTVRPQSVSKKTNPRYYELIRHFQNLTNIPALLNTSFNDKGEPIVCSPKDALRTFFVTGLDVLVMGDFIIKKREL